MIKDKGLISVVVCTFNGEKYLIDQLDSILNQTYTNIEIIIVDDCSTDNTKSLLLEYEKRDLRIKLFFNTVNLGYNKNFEKGITLANGEFVSICDQDDIWYLDKLEKLIDGIGNKGLIFSNSILINEKNEPTGKFLLEQTNFNDFDYRSLLLSNYISGHTILARTSFLQKTLPFPEMGFYDWWIGFNASYSQQITYLDETLTKYRIHTNSVIQQIEAQSNLNSLGSLSTVYRATSTQLKIFHKFLLERQDVSFINNFTEFFLIKTNLISRIRMFLLISYNYNMVFPLHRPRKWSSTTKYKIVNRYLKSILSCKQRLLGFK